MEGAYIAIGFCPCCNKNFGFNPSSVPTANGMPICKPCVLKANPIRIARGLQPFIIYPDSYEATEEVD